MTSAPQSPLAKNWSTLDFGLHALLAVSPFALGLWLFSLSPLVGGNLFLAVVLAGVVALLGAIVVGSLAQRWPLTGGDYAWQTRILGRRVGAVVALTSWWLVVTLLAPVYGNVILVQVIDPLLTYGGADALAWWFRGREGIFTCSLIAIAIATAFVGVGMRWAARLQRGLVVVGIAGLVLIFGLLFSGGPTEFRAAFDERSSELYGASPLAASQIVQMGDRDARVTELEAMDTLRLVPLVLLFGLWVGWAGPLAGETRARRPDAFRAALVRVAFASTLLGLVFLVAIGRGNTWDLWNEANNLYWGTVYGTTPATPLATWPNPVVFATWLTDNAFLQYGTIVAMSAWVFGATATLFLPATRVLLAAGADAVLPRRVALTTHDGVPRLALALLVVPACGFAALDAYWSWFAAVTAVAVVALGITMAGSAVAAFTTFRRSEPVLAAVCAGFVLLLGVVIGAWVFDSVYGMRRFATLGFLLGLYATAALVFVSSRRRVRAPLEPAPDVGG
jgi:amino acid transporter